MELPIDCAAEIAAWLADHGHDAVADTLPDDLETRLPITLLRSSGGSRTWPVLDRHRIGVDTYGGTVVDALDEARAVFALARALGCRVEMLFG